MMGQKTDAQKILRSAVSRKLLRRDCGIALVKTRQQRQAEEAQIRAILHQLQDQTVFDRLMLADDRERSRIKHDLQRKWVRVVV